MSDKNVESGTWNISVTSEGLGEKLYVVNVFGGTVQITGVRYSVFW